MTSRLAALVVLLAGCVHAPLGVADRDGDGVADANDACPDDPEDFDGFQDGDGCPDPDNDMDGIADVDDKCPNAPETINGFEDDDGCPDRPPEVVSAEQIVLPALQFDPGSAKLVGIALPFVDDLSKTIVENPDAFAVVEIAGHADDAEPNALALSRLRAEAVRDALVARGVEASRLLSQGYGALCPFDASGTKEGRRRNRVAVVVVVKSKSGPTGMPRGCPAATSAGVEPPKIP